MTRFAQGRPAFRRRLDCGAVLVGEVLPDYPSAAVGLWVNSGSRDEIPGREGAAHFVEHMVFKGTSRRDAREIALSLERVGGYLEAFTTKESTCFYARALASDRALATEVLCDLVSGPLFQQDDLARERGVILEEYHQVEDTPEELVGDLAMSRLWPGDLMGASILGTPASIQEMRTNWVREFHGAHYRGPNVVAAAVGNIDPEAVAELFNAQLTVPGEAAAQNRRVPPTSPAGVTWVEKDLSQLYVGLVTAAPPRDTADSRAAQLLVDILGGGMSSRLFQTLREDLGLVYSVQAYSEHFSDCGLAGITLGVSPENTEEALDALVRELKVMMREGPTPQEFDAALAAARGAILMEGESLTQRMLRLLGMEAEGRWYESVEDTVAKYESLTREDVQNAAVQLLEPDALQGVVVGPPHPGARAVFKNRPLQVVET